MRRTIVLLGLMLLAARSGAADLMIRERVTGSGPGVQKHEEMRYLTATRQISDGPHDRTIIDFDGKTMTWVDKDRKTYVVMTFDEMRRQNDVMQERLKEVPGVARQMMGMDAPVKFTETGKAETIAGYHSKEYRVEGGLTGGTVWVTDALEPPAAAGEWQRFAAAAGARSGPGGQLAEAMARLGGLPLRSSLTTTMGPVRITLDTEALEVRRESPPAELLKAPDGYKKVLGPEVDED